MYGKLLPSVSPHKQSIETFTGVPFFSSFSRTSSTFCFVEFIITSAPRFLIFSAISSDKTDVITLAPKALAIGIATDASPDAPAGINAVFPLSICPSMKRLRYDVA